MFETPFESMNRELYEETGLKYKSLPQGKLGQKYYVDDYNKKKDLYIWTYLTKELPSVSNMSCKMFHHNGTQPEITSYKYIEFDKIDKTLPSNLARVAKTILKKDGIL
jgi:hypothetical protein